MANTRQLHQWLGKLWPSVIKKISVDLSSQTVALEIDVSEGNDLIAYNVEFEGVSSFYYVAGLDGQRFNREEWDCVELSEIHYYENPVDHIIHNYSGNKRLDTYNSSANFVLEMWSSVLFIEARDLIVNNHRFPARKDTPCQAP